jgi:hypothetical protein
MKSVFVAAAFVAAAFSTAALAMPTPAANPALGRSREAMPQATQEAHWRGRGHHYGWHRGHHYGWRNHHRNWM